MTDTPNENHFDPSALLDPGGFGTLSPDCIKTFEEDRYQARPGEIVFNLEAALLNSLVSVLSPAAGRTSLHFVRFEVSPTSLTAQTYNHYALSEFKTGFSQPTQNVSNPISFALSFDSLKKAATACSIFVRFSFNIESGVLTIFSEGFERSIQTQDASLFVKPALPKRAQAESMEIDPTAFYKALAFVGAFVDKQSRDEFPVIRAFDGALLSADHGTIAKAAAPFLAGLNFSVQAELVPALLIALEEFRKSERAWAAICGNFLIFGNHYFTFGVCMATTLLTKNGFEDRVSQHRIMMPHASLSASLSQANLTNDKDVFSTIELALPTDASSGEGTLLTRSSENEITIKRIDIACPTIDPPLRWILPAKALQKAVQVWKHTNLEIHRLDVAGAPVFWMDFDDENSGSQRLYMATAKKEKPQRRRPKPSADK